jgi:hypothetical protein
LAQRQDVGQEVPVGASDKQERIWFGEFCPDPMQITVLNDLGLKQHFIGTHHLVRKDAVEAIMVERYQPIKALKLVRAHRSMYN